jgi:hypothetical protein
MLPAQSDGQPSAATSSRGRPKGMSNAASHGPGRRSDSSKAAGDVFSSKCSSFSNPGRCQRPQAQTMGLPRRGALEKSTPASARGADSTAAWGGTGRVMPAFLLTNARRPDAAAGALR